ncbi:MAG: helix-turn-helix domain-containing protein [Cyclonatronaceae bacterium]
MEALKLPSREDQQIAQENVKKLSKITGKHKKSAKAIEIEVSGGHELVKIPVSAFRFLNTIVKHMAQGRAVSIIPSDAEVTTQQAADMLNVSRPHVVKLVEKGDLPFHKVGSHRRIKLKDLEKYRARMEKKRGEALTELTRISQEMDLDY